MNRFVSRPLLGWVRKGVDETPHRRSYATLSSPTTAPSRSRKYARRVGYLIAGTGAVYTLDRLFNASAITRNCRTLYTCAMITLDYKFNFTEEKSDLIPELHQRVADRMYNLFTSNGGLYIKIGQAIGANAAFLPIPMQQKFAKLFDDAPQIPYSEVLSVFQSEFGRPPGGPNGVFEFFDENAIASASIAQVHKAKLWPVQGDTQERWVAVKVQKPAVSIQTEWDLGAYRMVMWIFENWAFDLPVYFVVDFVADHLRQELDFIREAHNAKRAAALIASEPRLSDKVYIPKVFDDLTTKKVMTAEWIDGVRFSDRQGVFDLMGEKPSRVGAYKIPLAVSPTEMHSDSPLPPKPLRGGVKAIMQTMIELFSAQMFSFGVIHCDPHPGNILIRQNPVKPDTPQLVLLDHGLYVTVGDEFRKQWAGLWKSLLLSDYKAVEQTARSWGVGLPDLFASATLMRPVRLKKVDKEKFAREIEEISRMSQYEQSVRMKAKLKEFLIDTDRLPKALIFLMRNMRIVQGNNQSMGAPVNRVKITGYWASRSLTYTRDLPLRQRIKEYWSYVAFRSIMFSLDVLFWAIRFRQWFWLKLGRYSSNFEDEIEKSMQVFAKGSLGMDVKVGVFQG
ncbi:ABC1-domain-containing protein [Guyanagaster necrorhizus]|uniref:ABC1-domain-containing protein n=1 Tax=Guyanagaster necrorhizus TaxID=856835 RepID=A0A9P7VK81_9AGAR|nr:ABC1-domain-containing protein [Guyanagaster necrorhizus MCA 3950]KAG7442157.1 ABC1-domain-containing protein [Guyanagaster necrorhizus MCA 3950]